MPFSNNFIKRILGPDERQMVATRPHWIYLLNGVWWFLGLAAFGWAVCWLGWYYGDVRQPEYRFTLLVATVTFQADMVGWLFTFAGGVVLLVDIVKYLTTRIVITNMRLIYKTGLIRIRIDETDLSDVRAVHVDQGLLGRFLGYGKLHLDCRFVKDVDVPFVVSPYKVVKILQDIRKQVDEHMAGRDFMEDGMAHSLIKIVPVYVDSSGAAALKPPPAADSTDRKEEEGKP